MFSLPVLFLISISSGEMNTHSSTASFLRDFYCFASELIDLHEYSSLVWFQLTYPRRRTKQRKIISTFCEFHSGFSSHGILLKTLILFFVFKFLISPCLPILVFVTNCLLHGGKPCKVATFWAFEPLTLSANTGFLFFTRSFGETSSGVTRIVLLRC